MEREHSPDRLLPSDPATRAIARTLLAEVESLPIISPHGHVDIATLVDDRPFADPATLLVTPDHYVTRLLHANGVDLGRLGLGADPASPREVWRTLCANWGVLDGTASSYWLSRELIDVFGLQARDPMLSPEHADASFDALAALLQRQEFRPRALFDQFGIAFLATTDDAMDTLDGHSALAADPTFSGRVAPTFRPDRYLDPAALGWRDHVERLVAETIGGDLTYRRFLDALSSRRQHFIRHGAVSADHGVVDASTARLDDAEASALFADLISGAATPDDFAHFRAGMLYQMARMSVDDGLVMTIHAGVHRNHHESTLTAFGPDTGHDIPIATGFTRQLQPLLADFGTARDFHLVLYTVDETAWSRELAPLAGFYPTVYLGAPWWFLDAPDAIVRFRAAVTETAGFSRSSGFVDDTRGFCSIPARHDAARRCEAAYLARLVVEKRLSERRAAEIIVDIVDRAPRRVFKL